MAEGQRGTCHAIFTNPTLRVQHKKSFSIYNKLFLLRKVLSYVVKAEVMPVSLHLSAHVEILNLLTETDFFVHL